MEKSEIKGFIAKRCAKELKNGDVVNLGIGLPTLIPNYLPEGVEVIIHAELGIVSAGVSPKEGDANYDPYHVVDAGGNPSSVAYGGGFIDSATNFGLIRGGHVDACFLGALEVDAEGNLANWIIPGKKMPGMGGAMDLCVGAKHCIVCMEHTAKGNPKIFEKCRLPLTASHCVNKIITEMCVFKVTKDGLLMTEIRLKVDHQRRKHQLHQQRDGQLRRDRKHLAPGPAAKEQKRHRERAQWEHQRAHLPRVGEQQGRRHIYGPDDCGQERRQPGRKARPVEHTPQKRRPQGDGASVKKQVSHITVISHHMRPPIPSPQAWRRAV